jgi:hypothetical protein
MKIERGKRKDGVGLSTFSVDRSTPVGSIPDQRADFLAEDGVLDGVLLAEVEDEDGYVVVEAE